MRPRDWAALLGLGFIWGASYLFIKVAVRDFPPATLVVVRLGLAGVLLAGLVAVRGLPVPRSSWVWARLVLLGTVSGGIPIGLIAWGERTLSSGAASILNATTPLWAVLFGHWPREEPLGADRVVGVTLGFAGVVVLVGADPAAVTREDLAGAGAVVLASALYAWGILYARRTFQGIDPVVLAAGSLLGGAAGLVPAAVLSGFPAKPSAESVGSLLALSVFGSAVAYLMYYHLVLNVRPTQTALVTYLNPATAVFWGWLVLGEPVTGQTLAGLVLIVAGIAVVNSRLTAAGSAAAPRGSPVAPPRSPRTGSGRRR